MYSHTDSPAAPLVSLLRFSGSQSPIASDWLDRLPVAADCLRDYQREHIGRAAAAIRRGVRRILMQGPTGSGKTHEIATMALCAWQADLSVLILATRTRLVRQLHERLEAFGVPHGVRAAGLTQLSNYSARVQVASADTLYRRCLIDKRAPLPSANVVVFDEAHLSLGASRLALLERYPDAWRIGFTATPAKVSGRSLGEQFEELILGPSVRELIARGALVGPRIFNRPVVSAADLKQIGRDSKTNDYTTGSLGALMSGKKLLGDVVSNWLRIANGRRTFCFAVNKSHGEQLTEEFRQAGIPAELLTDDTPEDEREAVIGRLERGETLIAISCFLLSYGVDVPSVECIILARPTRSLVLYLQTVGRGMRPSPETGKSQVILIDHGRVVEALGLPTEDFGWTLDQGANVSTAALALHGRLQTAERSRECPECSHLWMVSEDGPSCRACGWQYVPKAKPVNTAQADLAELDTRPEAATPVSANVARFYAEACGHYAQRWPDRWMQSERKGRWFAWCKTRERFGFAESEAMPQAYRHAPAMQPSKATAGWMLHASIRYAKRRCA